MRFSIRAATADDADALGRLFRDAVESAGPAHYSDAQVRAWAAAAHDPVAYGRRMLRHLVFVAESTGALDRSDGGDSGARIPLGFVGIAADGHVAALYVRGRCQGRGIGRALLQTVLTMSRMKRLPRLYAEASVFSLPLFERAGFTHYDTKTVTRDGVSFERYLVERRLEETSP